MHQKGDHYTFLELSAQAARKYVGGITNYSRYIFRIKDYFIAVSISRLRLTTSIKGANVWIAKYEDAEIALDKSRECLSSGVRGPEA